MWGHGGPGTRRGIRGDPCTPHSCLRHVLKMSRSLPPGRGPCPPAQGPPFGSSCPSSAADFSVCQAEVLLQNKSTSTAHGPEKQGKQARRKCQRGDGLLVSVRTSARCMSGADSQGRQLGAAESCKSHRVGASVDERAVHTSVRAPWESDSI